MTNDLVSQLIGLMVVILILVLAVIPTVIDAITEANVSGATGTILDLIPLFLGILGLIVVAGAMGFGRGM